MRLSKKQFLDRFSPAEMSAVLAAAKVSPDVEVWLFRFNSTTPDAEGLAIDTADPLTVAGLCALEHAGLIGPGRADQIIGNNGGAAAELAGLRVGDAVRVRPPFAARWPDVYVIADIGADAVQLNGGGSFAPHHLEPV